VSELENYFVILSFSEFSRKKMGRKKRERDRDREREGIKGTAED
jgi:hypothetical protein